jgi:hypothetical protein
MIKKILQIILISSLFFSQFLFAQTSSFALMKVPPYSSDITANKIDTSLYILKNTKASAIQFVILPNQNNNLHIIQKGSTCRGSLPAFGTCKLLISINPGDQLGLLRTNLTITTSDHIQYDFPLLFNIQKKQKDIQLSSSLHWEPLSGPNGGEFSSIVFSPIDKDTVYTAARGAGIYISTDAGKNWKSIAGDLPNFYVEKIVLKGTDIYVLIANQGIFKSIDQGAHWKSVNNGLPPEYIGDLVTSNNILYAGTTWNGIDVYQSQNDAETWTKTSTNNFPGNPIQSLLVEDNVIYVGTTGPGLYKSIDGGKTWITIITGENGIENINSLLDINGTLYAGGLSYSKRSVLKSTDQGMTWGLFF